MYTTKALMVSLASLLALISARSRVYHQGNGWYISGPRASSVTPALTHARGRRTQSSHRAHQRNNAPQMPDESPNRLGAGAERRKERKWRRRGAASGSSLFRPNFSPNPQNRPDAYRRQLKVPTSAQAKADGKEDPVGAGGETSTVISDWDILGITAESSIDSVKRAYRALVKLHHPDTGGDEQRFQVVKDAFERIVGRSRSSSGGGGARSQQPVTNEGGATVKTSDPLQEEIQPYIDRGMAFYDADDVGNANLQLQQAYKIWRDKGKSAGSPAELPVWVMVLCNNVIGMRRAMARELARRGEFAGSLIMYREALDLNDETLQSKPTKIYILNQMGQLEGMLGRHKQSLDYFNEVLALIEKGPEKMSKGVVLANLANEYMLMGDPVNCFKTYHESLEILFAEKERDDEDKAKQLQDSSEEGGRGKMNISSTQTEASAGLERKVKNNEALSKVARNFVIMCNKAFAEARENQTDWHSINKCGEYLLGEKLVKMDTLAYGLCLKSWGTGVARAGNFELGLKLLEIAKTLLITKMGECVELADCIQEIGVARHQMGDHKAALREWLTAYQMNGNAMGGYQNVDAALIGVKIAAVLISEGEAEQALKFLGVSLSTLLEVLPPEDVRVKNAQQLLPIARKMVMDKEDDNPYDMLRDEEEFLDEGWESFEVPKQGIETWREDQVIDWAGYVGLDEDTIKVLRQQRIDGEALLMYEVGDMVMDGIPRGQAMKIRRFIDQDKIREFRQKQQELDSQRSGGVSFPKAENIPGDELDLDFDIMGNNKNDGGKDVMITSSMVGESVAGTYKGQRVLCTIVPGNQEGLDEIQNMRKVPICNECVELLGVAVVQDYILLVTPWYAKKSVREAYINTEAADALVQSAKEFIEKIALPSAKGVGHLHKYQILHKNLQSSKLLVDESGKAVVSGWNPVTIQDKSNNAANQGMLIRTEEGGRKQSYPVRWMAPEALAGNFSKASDVWSLAVAWSEVLNQNAEPYEGMSAMMVIAKVTAGRLFPQINSAVKQQLPRPFVQLYHRMLERSPAKRPDMQEIVQRLEYLKEKLDQDPSYGCSKK